MKTIEYDVAVAGGGLAGCAAAIASARYGRKTVLIEQSGVLGGQASLGLVTPMGSIFKNSGSGQDGEGEAFGGLCREIYSEARNMTFKYGAPSDYDAEKIDINPHITKYVLLKKCLDCGVEIMFHSTVIDTSQTELEVKGIITVTKSGIINIAAKAFVDCTGDADIVYKSGAPYKIGSESTEYTQLEKENITRISVSKCLRNKDCDTNTDSNGNLQPVSIFFRLGGVDTQKAFKYNNKKLTYENMNIDIAEFKKLPYYNECGFNPCEDRLPMPQGRVLATYGSAPDTAAVNMSRVVNIDASDSESLNRGECLAQIQVLNIIDFLKRYIPGYENSYLIESGSTLGIRESRRMVGRYILKAEDVIECKKFDDAVAYGSYIIDIHNPKGNVSGAIGGMIKGTHYDIPLRCLQSEKFENLFAGGRCISADHVAHSTTRIQGTCMMTGQAAGIAAAIYSSENTVSYSDVQKVLG